MSESTPVILTVSQLTLLAMPTQSVVSPHLLPVSSRVCVLVSGRCWPALLLQVAE